MKLNNILIVGYILTTLVLAPINVKATTYQVNAGSTIYITYSLKKGDTINWDWHTTDVNEGLDFWIEDGSGTKYSYDKGIQHWTNSFSVPDSGTWYVKWYNDNLIFSVTVEYDISITYSDTNGGSNNSSNNGGNSTWWLLPVILIIVIAVVCVVIILAMRNKKQHPIIQQNPQVIYSAPNQNVIPQVVYTNTPQNIQPQPVIITQTTSQPTISQIKKFCSKCGKELKPEFITCPFCGAK